MDVLVYCRAIPVVLLCSLTLVVEAASARRGVPIVMGETITVASKSLERSVAVDVYLPERYAQSDKRYPVLVTCQSTGLHVAGIAADVAVKSGAPEMIVASVRGYTSNDFIPEAIEGHPGSPGADRFLDFLGAELIPELDRRYRTHPFRLLYSGSFGGGFCVYTLLTRPALFDAYLAATPAIDYEGASTLILSKLDTWLATRSYTNRSLYMGVEDDPQLVAALDQFTERLRRHNPQGLRWEYHHFLDEDHASIPNKVVYHGLRFAFEEWTNIPDPVAAAGVPAIRKYVAGLKEKFGYDIGIARSAISRVARAYREANRSSDLIELLRFGVECHPNAEMAWLGLGRAYIADGQLQQAAAALGTAHRLAVENGSPHLAIFEDALTQLEEKAPDR